MAKRILVPLDRTSTSEAVLPFVSDLAHGAGSTVRLLRVEPVPNNVVSDSGRVVAYTDQEMARLEAEGLAHLDAIATRSEEHTSELQSLAYLVCRLLLEKKKKRTNGTTVTFAPTS